MYVQTDVELSKEEERLYNKTFEPRFRKQIAEKKNNDFTMVYKLRYSLAVNILNPNIAYDQASDLQMQDDFIALGIVASAPGRPAFWDLDVRGMSNIHWC